MNSEQSQSPLPVFILFLDCLAQIMAQNLADFLHSYSILVSFCEFCHFLTFDLDYDRIESGILFDSSKNCLWSYIEEAVQISNVTQEPTCPNLVNLTYAPNDGLITVSGTQ